MTLSRSKLDEYLLSKEKLGQFYYKKSSIVIQVAHLREKGRGKGGDRKEREEEVIIELGKVGRGNGREYQMVNEKSPRKLH